MQFNGHIHRRQTVRWPILKVLENLLVVNDNRALSCHLMKNQGGFMRRLQYHSTPSTTPSFTTMNMVLDSLHDHGFEILERPSKEQHGLRRIAVLSEKSTESAFLPAYAPDPSTVIRIMRFADIAKRKDLCVPPCLVFLSPETAKHTQSEASAQCHACGLALVTPQEGVNLEFGNLVSIISNYLTQVVEFESTLTQIVKANGSFQDLVNAAEPFFGRYIGITDANDALIAHTYSTFPNDPINSSLVSLGFHTKQLTESERGGSPISHKIAVQNDIALYKPKPPFPYELITHAIRIKKRFYAYVVMTCPEREVTDGLLDSFLLFAHMCDKLARRKAHEAFNGDHMISGFLMKLATEKSLDQVFLREQADRLQIPTHGMFTLASILIQRPLRDQLEHVARRIDRSIDCRHWILIEQDRIYVLFHADTWSVAMEANVQLSELKLNEPYEMHSSDVYEELGATYFAFKQLASIEKYISFVRHCRMLTCSQKHENVFAFHDVFCFYWDDPFADEELRGFAMDHTRLSKMEHDDECDNTNNVPLLNAYLIMERKATQVGELFHMHRNGVIYRMEKIEKTYHLDLDDYLTRQYLQTCARIKLIATNRFTILGINNDVNEGREHGCLL